MTRSTVLVSFVSKVSLVAKRERKVLLGEEEREWEVEVELKEGWGRRFGDLEGEGERDLCEGEVGEVGERPLLSSLLKNSEAEIKDPESDIES